MIQSFKDGKDIYGSIASIAFNVPYEECLEFHPETHEYQPEGKARRGEAKTIVLGICYGRSVQTIADQLYGKDDTLSDDEKIAKAQNVFDSVLLAFPGLRALMNNAQNCAKQKGYVETILGRRRHIPEMQLPKFEFVPEPGYINPDVDPLDPSTLANKNGIPDRIIRKLTTEFESYKYYGQIYKRMKELKEDHIKVINNSQTITDASRKCVNSIIQGSAAEQTKMAMLLIENNEEWKRIGGRLLIPVHDELIAEVPIENYEEGAELLSSMMCEAANFLPFESKCDVEITYRWYGLSFPCPYPQPSEFNDDLSRDEIKWIQYHLFESGYELPKIKAHEDDELRGDEALGISGFVSDEYHTAIDDYLNRYSITKEQFINHIHTKVHTGVIPTM
jgi:DNA polymerase I-like protein with 3'-5' exonuclease and polymerase domains